MTSDGNFANLSLSTGWRCNAVSDLSALHFLFVTIPPFSSYGRMEKIGNTLHPHCTIHFLLLDHQRDNSGSCSLSPFFTKNPPWRMRCHLSNWIDSQQSTLRILTLRQYARSTRSFPHISEPCMVSRSPGTDLIKDLTAFILMKDSFTFFSPHANVLFLKVTEECILFSWQYDLS